MLSEPMRVTLLVIEALEALGVPFLLGGSLASALYGVTRATMDSDLVADLRPEHARPLASALGDEFYADAESICDAIEHQNSITSSTWRRYLRWTCSCANHVPSKKTSLSAAQRRL